MLPEIALSAALTLGSTTTAQTEMPFTMYFASAPEAVTQNIVNNMSYDPHQQLTTIDSNIVVADSSSTSTKSSGTTTNFGGIGTDYDADTQTDD